MKKISKDWILTISLSVIVVLILIIDTVWYYFWEVKNQQEIAQVEEKIEVINSFSDYARKLKIRRKENSAEWYRTIETLKNGDNITIKIDNEGNAYFELSGKLEKKYGSEYKIASNVIKAGAMKYGQDGAIVIYAINNSGEFSYSLINLTSNELKMQTIDSFKNIVEVQRYNNGETSMLLVAIDIDGIMHDIKIK